MEKKYSEHKETILRLTYLWAFAEGGLGGMMHLLHIPMTGFLIGGISVIINVFIAAYSKVNARTMLSSLGLVLLCKFALSPHSPLGAYVAVSFQGILALLIFSIVGVNRFSILLYAILVMLENAIQKPLMAYLIFRDELIQGISITVNKFFKNRQLTENFLFGLTSIYFGIYTIWALIIGHWAYAFLGSIEKFKLDSSILLNQRQLPSEKPRGNKKVIWVIMTFSVIFFFLFFYFSSVKVHWTIYALKAFTWFLILALILPFILRFILQYFSKRSESKVLHSLSLMPAIKENMRRSFEFVSKDHGFAKIRNFMFYSIYLNVFHSPQNEQ